MCSSPFGGNFLRAVTRHRDRFKGNLSHQQSQLRRAVKANEVAWGDIDRALEALGPSDTTFVPNSAGANDKMAGGRSLSRAYDRDSTLDWGRESSRQSRDRGESPSQLDYTATQCGTLVHGEGSSQRTSLEEVNSSGCRRNLDGEGHQGKLDIIIDPPPST